MAQVYRIITYNINRGLSSVKKRDALAAMVGVLKDARAQVACLQEVWEEDGITENALETLTGRIWPHYVFNRNAVFPGGGQGNAVLCRDQVTRWSNVDVSVGQAEPRGLLDVRIQAPFTNGELVIICLHLGLKASERQEQVRRLVDHLERDVDPLAPLVVAGDFNDWRSVLDGRLQKQAGLENALGGGFRRGRTFPALLPVFSLDRIYYRNLKLVQSRVMTESGWKGLSDHLPVVADFGLGDDGEGAGGAQ